MVPTQSQSEIISTSTQALLELATLQAVKLLAVNIKNCTYNNKLGPTKKQETNSHRNINFTSQQGHKHQGHTYQMSSSITILIMVMLSLFYRQYVMRLRSVLVSVVVKLSRQGLEVVKLAPGWAASAVLYWLPGQASLHLTLVPSTHNNYYFMINCAMITAIRN